jgi:hypothetical protein
MGSTAEKLRPEYSMDDLAAVRPALDRMLLGDPDPMLALLTDDVALQVAVGGDEPSRLENRGKQPVVDYFSALGGMMTFSQIDYTAAGDQLIAWGKEDFTIEPCGIEASSEFALVFDFSEGLITRLLVVEDLPSFIRNGGTSPLADSLPLEVEMHPVSCGDDTGQLPMLTAEPVQLTLGRESIGLEVPDDFLVFPVRLDRHPGCRDVPAPWLGWPRRKWNFESC